jgi:hypothetical protein
MSARRSGRDRPTMHVFPSSMHPSSALAGPGPPVCSPQSARAIPHDTRRSPSRQLHSRAQPRVLRLHGAEPTARRTWIAGHLRSACSATARAHPLGAIGYRGHARARRGRCWTARDDANSRAHAREPRCGPSRLASMRTPASTHGVARGCRGTLLRPHSPAALPRSSRARDRGKNKKSGCHGPSHELTWEVVEAPVHRMLEGPRILQSTSGACRYVQEPGRPPPGLDAAAEQAARVRAQATTVIVDTRHPGRLRATSIHFPSQPRLHHPRTCTRVHTCRPSFWDPSAPTFTPDHPPKRTFKSARTRPPYASFFWDFCVFRGARALWRPLRGRCAAAMRPQNGRKTAAQAVRGNGPWAMRGWSNAQARLLCWLALTPPPLLNPEQMISHRQTWLMRC